MKFTDAEDAIANKTFQGGYDAVNKICNFLTKLNSFIYLLELENACVRVVADFE